MIFNVECSLWRKRHQTSALNCIHKSDLYSKCYYSILTVPKSIKKCQINLSLITISLYSALHDNFEKGIHFCHTFLLKLIVSKWEEETAKIISTEWKGKIGKRFEKEVGCFMFMFLDFFIILHMTFRSCFLRLVVDFFGGE